MSQKIVVRAAVKVAKAQKGVFGALKSLRDSTKEAYKAYKKEVKS